MFLFSILIALLQEYDVLSLEKIQIAFFKTNCTVKIKKKKIKTPKTVG